MTLENSEAAEALLSDPVGDQTDLTRHLATSSEDEFAAQWLLHSLKGEFRRYAFEDDFVSLESSELTRLADAFSRIEAAGNNAFDPAIAEALIVCRSIALRQRNEKRSEVRTLPADQEGEEGHFILRRSSDQDMQVSNQWTNEVPIFEETLANPEYGRQIVERMSRRIEVFAKRHAISHLCFIEKEMGPVGALPALSALVAKTGIPAFIFRETHWSPMANKVGAIPHAGDRVLIVYDMLVSGAGVRQAAEAILEQTGGETLAAVFLSAYGERRSHIDYDGGARRFEIDALTWLQSSPVVRSATPTHPEVRDVPAPVDGKEELMAKNLNPTASRSAIQPGSYTTDTLPNISQGAQKILDALRKKSSARSKKETPAGASAHRSAGLIHLKDSGNRAGQASDVLDALEGTFKKSQDDI